MQMIEPLYEVLRLVDSNRTAMMWLVYAKLEVAKKRIIATSAKYSYMFIDIVKDRWDRQMSRDLHMAVTSVVDRMSRNHEKVAAALNELKYFREGIGSFDDPSAIASQQKLDPERKEMELDEEADDPDDPPRPNTFLVSVIERMQAGGDARVSEDTPVTQTHHLDSEVDLDDDIQVGSLTRADREPTTRNFYEMDTTDLDMLIQPRAPPESQSVAPPSSRPRGPPPRPPSLSKSSSTHRHGSSQTHVI
ncbi:hypothetical protein Taro_019029 [Colocasia esculenta]|uniref:Uncharacterized protein n=1 Tax=Colocasia esculenta TaxID=4460 RepID=A0A843USM9_COLES|nr:hypothetical protein [Colocasia esculenta]